MPDEQDDEGYDGQFVQIYGDKYAKDREHPQVAYQRFVSKRLITFTCVQCTKTVTQWRYPSRGPKYCSDSCRDEAHTEQTRERVRRYRERKAKQAPQPPPPTSPA